MFGGYLSPKLFSADYEGFATMILQLVHRTKSLEKFCFGLRWSWGMFERPGIPFGDPYHKHQRFLSKYSFMFIFIKKRAIKEKRLI